MATTVTLSSSRFSSAETARPRVNSELILFWTNPREDPLYTERIRLGFPTVMIWICSSLMPRSRSMGRNLVAI